jgi:hypothetical protein
MKVWRVFSFIRIGVYSSLREKEKHERGEAE